MTDSFFIGIVILSAIAVGIMLSMKDVLTQRQPALSPSPSPSISHLPSPHSSVRKTIVNVDGDARYRQSPQPLRDWMSPPEFPPRGGIASIPINIPTQGLPESFQMVGNINSDGKMLPLYGRRTIGSSDRWNYYSRTDSYNPVPLPVQYQKRDCMDDVGCQELLGGETIKLEGTGQAGKVKMYRYDGPRYIPGLF